MPAQRVRRGWARVGVRKPSGEETAGRCPGYGDLGAAPEREGLGGTLGRMRRGRLGVVESSRSGVGERAWRAEAPAGRRSAGRDAAPPARALWGAGGEGG
jgi:hypothetical protein